MGSLEVGSGHVGMIGSGNGQLILAFAYAANNSTYTRNRCLDMEIIVEYGHSKCAKTTVCTETVRPSCEPNV